MNLKPRTAFRRFRRSKKMSQRQLALALDITSRAVKYIEAGEREPSSSTWMRFRELVERHERESINAG